MGGRCEGHFRAVGRRRVALFKELKRLGTPGDWRFILEQVGMFS